MLHSISGRIPEHVHNEYLEVFAEQGFVGLILLTALLAYFAWFGALAILREPSPALALQNVAVYGAFIVMLVDAVFSFPWRLPVSLIVFMIVLAWMHETIYPQPAPETPAP
jgi:O-antigen ligase